MIFNTIRKILLWLLDIFFMLMMIAGFANGGTLSGILLLIAIIITNPLILDKIPKLKWKATAPISIVLFFISIFTFPTTSSDDTVTTNQLEEVTTTTPVTTVSETLNTTTVETTITTITTTEESTTKLTTTEEVITTISELSSMDIIIADKHPKFNDEIKVAREYYDNIAETLSTAILADDFKVMIDDAELISFYENEDYDDKIEDIEIYLDNAIPLDTAVDIAKEYVPSVYSADESWKTEDEDYSYQINTYLCDNEDYPNKLYVVIKSVGDNVEQVSIAVMSAIPRNLQTEKVVTEKVTEEPKTEKKTEKETDTYKVVETLPTVNSYVLNTSTHKFHKPSCGDVDKISAENYATFEGSRDEVIAQGYDPCGHCKP